MKIYISYFGLLLSILTAKLAFPQVSFSISSGLNTSHILSNINYDRQNVQHGFNAGIASQVPLIGSFGVESGLFYTTKGFKSITSSVKQTSWWQYDTTIYSSSISINYIELPLKIFGTVKLGNARFMGSAGPYFGLGVGGRKLTDVTKNGEKSSYSDFIKFGTDPKVSYYRNMDYGLALGTGIYWPHFLIGASYDIGLENIAVSRTSGNLRKNRSWSLNMGYRFDLGSINSSDYESRIRAVKRLNKQDKLLKIAQQDDNVEVRKAAFGRLNENSLNLLIKEAKDPALVLSAKIRLGQTSWNDAFAGKNIPLNHVIGAAALVASPMPTSYDVVTACHKFIQLGDASRIPELIYLLNTFGDVDLAEDFMNCGESTLESAGCTWGRKHGYTCTTGNGSARVRWGSNK